MPQRLSFNCDLLSFFHLIFYFSALTLLLWHRPTFFQVIELSKNTILLPKGKTEVQICSVEVVIEILQPHLFFTQFCFVMFVHEMMLGMELECPPTVLYIQLTLPILYCVTSTNSYLSKASLFEFHVKRQHMASVPGWRESNQVCHWVDGRCSLLQFLGRTKFFLFLGSYFWGLYCFPLFISVKDSRLLPVAGCFKACHKLPNMTLLC